MQYKTIKTLSKLALLASFAFAISFATKADAATYFIDPTGQGCNASCQTLLSDYFSNLNTTNTNSNSSTNGSSTTATSTSTSTSTSTTGGNGNVNVNGNGNGYGGPVDYPNYQYQYNTTPASSNGTGYVQYPYMTYSYFSNPKPSTTTANTYVPYPTPVYVYYGKDTASQLKQYQQSVGSVNPYTGYGNSGYSNTGSEYGYSSQYGANGQLNYGFTMTSGF